MDDSFKNPTDAVQLRLNGFEGPLDLLLELARRQRVDLVRISITELVDQYLAAVAAAGSIDLVRIADWLVMAAWLTWLKSRLMLPIEKDAACEGDQAQRVLTHRLAELERVRVVTSWLDEQKQLGWDTFERGVIEPSRDFLPVAGYLSLLEACLSVLKAEIERPAMTDQPRRIAYWTPKQAISRIEAMLGNKPGGGDLLSFVPRLLPEPASRTERARTAISSTFVASLELARQGRILMCQNDPFTVIVVSRNDNSSWETPNA